MTITVADCKRRTIWAQRALLVILLIGLAVLGQTAHTQRELSRGLLVSLAQTEGRLDLMRAGRDRLQQDLGGARGEIEQLQRRQRDLETALAKALQDLKEALDVGHDLPIFGR